MHMPRFLIHALKACYSQCPVFLYYNVMYLVFYSVQCVDNVHTYIVQREKKTLGVKRLDLDAAKNRTKKQSGEKLQQVT